MKLRALVLLAVTASLACGEQYKYTEGRNGTVRVDRATGRSEMLVRSRTGNPEWRVIGEAAAVAAQPSMPVVRNHVAIAANDPGLRVSAGVIGARRSFNDPTDEVFGVSHPLTVSVQNDTAYDLDAVRLRLQYDGVNVLETVGPIHRGRSSTYEIPLRGALVSWNVEGATGTSIQ